MTRLTQTEEYPKGDCFRTSIACILGCDRPEEVPNFMEDGETHFYTYFNNWLKAEGITYIEVACDSENGEHPFIQLPEGMSCILVGKSPRGEYDHAVVGKVGPNRFIEAIHDPSPHRGEVFVEGPIKYIGLLFP